MRAETQLGMPLATSLRQPTAMKPCPKCGTSKPVTDFYRDPSRKDGRYHSCIPCTRRIESTLAMQRVRHDRASCGACVEGGVRYCTVCKDHRPAEAFGLLRGRPMSFCSLCDRRRKRKPAAPRDCVSCGLSFLRARKDQTVCGDTWCTAERDRAKTREKLMASYGITEDDYQRMLREQDGKCAICGTDNPGIPSRPTSERMCVDHDHATGRVRGLLCQPCNSGLGKFRDDPNALRAAAEYILRSRGAK